MPDLNSILNQLDILSDTSDDPQSAARDLNALYPEGAYELVKLYITYHARQADYWQRVCLHLSDDAQPILCKA